jgi:hypothetical protein
MASSTASLAMRRAGYIGGDHYVNVTDIGLLMYRNADEPKLVRNADIWSDTDYVRPFVELWSPYPSRGMVRFELVDSEGRLRYADEAEYDLARGSNALVPGTWLPQHGAPVPTGRWRLRVLAAETLLAAHTFGWQAADDNQIKELMASDGELSPELQQALLGRSDAGMSLSDLLADQEK